MSSIQIPNLPAVVALGGSEQFETVQSGVSVKVTLNQMLLYIKGYVSSSGGSKGMDYSANKPALPNVGANFGSTGPYANYVLITTVPATSIRYLVDIENDSGYQIAIVRDDGTAATGSQPMNASVFSLGPGSGVGAQGGSWTSTTFYGRLQIYAPSSSAQVSVMVD